MAGQHRLPIAVVTTPGDERIRNRETNKSRTNKEKFLPYF